MLTPDPGPHAPATDAPSDELVLAAIERAAIHRGRESPAVPVWEIFEHLDVPLRSARARHVRVRLDVMHAAGWIALSRRHGVQTWELTGPGAGHLRRERRAGRVPALPESPQHRRWRNAHTTAGQEIGRFRAALRARLEAALAMLELDPPPRSDDWLELAQRLQWECRRLGSATYCLREWVEPDDARADIDERLDVDELRLDRAERARRRAPRAGRRNVKLWDEGPGS